MATTKPTSPHTDATDTMDHAVVDFHKVRSPVKASAPPADWPSYPVHVASSDTTTPIALAAPELLPPSARAKRGLAWLTLKLVPFHVLNFLLGTGAFIVVVTGVSLAGGLLPLCCLGVPIYFLLLQLTRIMVAMDIALANTITRSQAAARWNVSDDMEQQEYLYGLRIAPQLTRVSARSTLAVLYFASVKFALGVASGTVVCVPFMPLAVEIVALAGAPNPTYVAGWNVHAFNFSTHPVWFVLVFVGYFGAGIVLLHVVGWFSREATRRVCCVDVVPKATATESAAV